MPTGPFANSPFDSMSSQQIIDPQAAMNVTAAGRNVLEAEKMWMEDTQMRQNKAKVEGDWEMEERQRMHEGIRQGIQNATSIFGSAIMQKSRQKFQDEQRIASEDFTAKQDELNYYRDLKTRMFGEFPDTLGLDDPVRRALGNLQILNSMQNLLGTMWQYNKYRTSPMLQGIQQMLGLGGGGSVTLPPAPVMKPYNEDPWDGSSGRADIYFGNRSAGGI